MSNVEIVKRPIAASASGRVTDARTPIASSGSGPRSFRRAQPRSAWNSTPSRPAGRRRSSQTIESSSDVRVTDENARPAQPGTAAFGGSRQIA